MPPPRPVAVRFDDVHTPGPWLLRVFGDADGRDFGAYGLRSLVIFADGGHQATLEHVEGWEDLECPSLEALRATLQRRICRPA
jgi:hypothetical protein